MKTITRLVSIAAVFTLVLSAVANAATKADRANKYFIVAGTVLQIDKNEHRLLVEDRSSSKLYLVQMSDGAALKIAFGRFMKLSQPGFEDVNVGERIEIRCRRDDREHLALLPNGRGIIQITADR